MKYLTLDVGTTCCKTQLFDETGEILFYRTKECPLMKQDGQTYVDIDGIASSVKDLIRDAADAFPFDSIAVSSFGEAFVTLDKDDNIVTYPMLYTDPRGKEEAEFLGRTITSERLFRTTGTHAEPDVFRQQTAVHQKPRPRKIPKNRQVPSDLRLHRLSSHGKAGH